MAPACVSPPLRYRESCPLVGTADTPSVTDYTSASLRFHRFPHPLLAALVGALTASLRSLPGDAPLGPLQVLPPSARTGLSPPLPRFASVRTA